MLKSNEFKAFGSIRKTKVAGACGVILALAILGIAFGSNNVSADEVKPTTPVVVEKKTEVEVPVAHDNLDKAVTEAKEPELAGTTAVEAKEANAGEENLTK